MQRTITIVGGGLAGLTLGILLRRQGVPVEIWDAGLYPRHRVCGEFISGRGVELLQQLEVPGISVETTLEASTAAFFHRSWRSPSFTLSRRALAIDRATLDHALAREFKAQGGILHESRRWTASFESEGLVRATGRRLSKNGEATFVGLKVHASEFPLEADLELHFSEDAYVGLSRLRGGSINICGLFRASAAFQHSDFRSGAVFKSVLASPARERIASARFDENSFSAMAGISLKREASRTARECRIGDNICMIAPLTGNGMSIAMESAFIAAPFLQRYSVGGDSWACTQDKISQSCDQKFRRRLFSASILQTSAFNAMGRRAMMYLLETSPRVFNLWFRATR